MKELIANSRERIAEVQTEEILKIINGLVIEYEVDAEKLVECVKTARHTLKTYDFSPVIIEVMKKSFREKINTFISDIQGKLGSDKEMWGVAFSIKNYLNELIMEIICAE